MSRKHYADVCKEIKQDKNSVDVIDRFVLDIINIILDIDILGDGWFELEEKTRDRVFEGIRNKINQQVKIHFN